LLLRAESEEANLVAIALRVKKPTLLPSHAESEEAIAKHHRSVFLFFIGGKRDESAALFKSSKIAWIGICLKILLSIFQNCTFEI
jgi:hypothetical protein